MTTVRGGRLLDRYGEGRHGVKLNFGDGLGYACAKTAGASLLFRGDDFADRRERSSPPGPANSGFSSGVERNAEVARSSAIPALDEIRGFPGLSNAVERRRGLFDANDVASRPATASRFCARGQGAADCGSRPDDCARQKIAQDGRLNAHDSAEPTRPRTHRPFVDAHPAKRPERVTLEGRWITLAPLDPEAHAEALYEGSNGDPAREAVWTYLFDGPYREPRGISRRDLELKARSADPLFFAMVDNATGRAVGYQTLMRIDAANRVIEVGNIMYTPGDAAHGRRDRGAISVRATCVRRRSAIAATSGSATTSTRPPEAPRSGSASPSRASSAST